MKRNDLSRNFNFRNSQEPAALNIFRVLFVAMVMALIGVVFPRDAEALPSFARQTGQACGSCHTDFPQLTPFGRRFKLGGYTLGGGQDSSEYKKVFGSNQWVPPISFMGQITLEQTKKGQGTSDFGSVVQDTQLSMPQGSIFYGGAITNELGAFVQATLGAGSGFALDNTDIRYVKSGSLFGKDILVGITAHNNPTVQDAWNTQSAWGFPFIGPSIAPTPAASTAIEGAFSGKVLGIGAYTFIDDKLYLEATVYKGFDRRWQNTLINSGNFDNTVMDKLSPYFRVAFEPHWGNHWLMVGGYWFSTSKNNCYDTNDVNLVCPGPGPWLGGSDKFVDIGVDAQYQYMGDNYALTLRANYVHEKQTLDSSFANMVSDNPTNRLNSFKAQASYAWNTATPGNKWVFTAGYFNTWGSTDCLLYQGSTGCSDPTVTTALTGSANGSPNSNGWIAEIAWFPYAMSKSPLWPYFNARVGLQYTWYNKFNGASSNYDGNGRNASDNNTLLMYYWFAL